MESQKGQKCLSYIQKYKCSTFEWVLGWVCVSWTFFFFFTPLLLNLFNDEKWFLTDVTFQLVFQNVPILKDEGWSQIHPQMSGLSPEHPLIPTTPTCHWCCRCMWVHYLTPMPRRTQKSGYPSHCPFPHWALIVSDHYADKYSVDKPVGPDGSFRKNVPRDHLSVTQNTGSWQRYF